MIEPPVVSMKYSRLELLKDSTNLALHQACLEHCCLTGCNATTFSLTLRIDITSPQLQPRLILLYIIFVDYSRLSGLSIRILQSESVWPEIYCAYINENARLLAADRPSNSVFESLCPLCGKSIRVLEFTGSIRQAVYPRCTGSFAPEPQHLVRLHM